MNTSAVPPILVFGWGNLSRGDDALGPMCLDHLRAAFAGDHRVECLDDYQLQVEHALDLVGRQRVLFVDASLNCQAPFEVTQVHAAQDASFTTHAMSPQALMQVFADLQGVAPPPCTLLAIRGDRFELGEAPSAQALAHLDAALQWARMWLGQTEAQTQGPREELCRGGRSALRPGEASEEPNTSCK